MWTMFALNVVAIAVAVIVIYILIIDKNIIKEHEIQWQKGQTCHGSEIANFNY